MTLVELLVVIALMAALSTVATIRLSGPYRAARGQQQSDELIEWLRRGQELVATHAESSRIVWDFGSQEFRHEGSAVAENRTTFALTSAVKIEEIRLAERIYDRGEVELAMSALGQLPTLALRLHPAVGEPYWLLWVGGSGQTRMFGLEAIHEVMQLLQTRPDAG